MRSRGGEDESLEAARLLLLLQTLLDHRKTHLADGAPPALAQLVLCVVADLLHIRLHQVGQHLLRHKPLHVQPARHQRRCVVLAHVPSHLCSAHHHLLALLAPLLGHTGGQQHALRDDSAHFGGLQVAQHHHPPPHELLRSHVPHKARYDRARASGVSAVHLLHEQPVCVRVPLHAEYAPHTHLHTPYVLYSRLIALLLLGTLLRPPLRILNARLLALLSPPGVLERHHAVEPERGPVAAERGQVVARVEAEVAHSLELIGLPWERAEHARLRHCALQHAQAVRVQVLQEVSLVLFARAGLAEQPVVLVEVGRNSVRLGDPLHNAAHLLLPLGGGPRARGGVVRAAQLHRLPSRVAHHLIARDDIRILQTHLPPRQQALVPLGRSQQALRARVKKVLPVDVQRARKRQFPVSQFGSFGMLFGGEHLGGGFGRCPVGQRDLQWGGNGEDAGRLAVQHLPGAVLQHRQFDIVLHL
mmetsp:Transcript_35033/g.75631  ORF Transcript_35033/g.75631 Transcript_35033/m.75631 type:complete len:473 (-) Transcript_35033:1268-2686(-)